MLRYLGKRFLNYVALLFIATSLTYLLAASRLDPRALWAVQQPPVDPAIVEAQLRQYNLSDQVPLLQRYGTWLSGVLHGSWGYSPLGVSVNEQISARMWVSLRLLLIGTLLGILVGIAVGAWTATRQYRISDRVATALSLLVISTPVFVIGSVAQIAAIWFNDATGVRVFEFIGESGSIGDYPLAPLVDRLQHLVLPTLVLTVLGAAAISRIQRNLMLDALSADYVRTAKAKGVPHRQAVLRHALRTALAPMSTYISFTVATMFIGATFTERIFGFAGLGEYGVDSIAGRDVNAVVAVTAVAAVCVLSGALLSDIMLGLLDPRVRLK